MERKEVKRRKANMILINLFRVMLVYSRLKQLGFLNHEGTKIHEDLEKRIFFVPFEPFGIS